MRTINRALCAAALAAALAAGSGTAAFAHECLVSNRSEQGHRDADHSPMWTSENMATHGAYAFTFDFVGIEPTEAMLDEAVRRHQMQGLQDWTAFFQGHTLLADQKTHADTPAATKHSADGRGVDHWSDSDLGKAMTAIALDVAEDLS